MPTITSFDGCRINVREEGPADAPAILLSHYLGGQLETFDALSSSLASTHRVVRFDTRGHGDSEATEGNYSVEILGRDALAVLHALKLERVDFLGVSQGGMTGMWLGSERPECIQRLILANTTPFIPNKAIWDQQAERARHDGMTDIAQSTISGWLSESFRKREPEKVNRAISYMAAMSPLGFAGNTAVLRDVDMRNALEIIAAPTLVIGGAEDGPRGASAPVMAESVQNGQLVIIPGAAHLSHLENPEAFNEAVVRFLDG